MQPLEKSLRNSLERTLTAARDIAEAAARAALEQLGVGESAPSTTRGMEPGLKQRRAP